MDLANLSKLNEARAARRAAMLVKDIGTGEDIFLKEGDLPPPGLEEAVAKAFRTGKSGSVEDAGKIWFLNVHLPPPRLVVIGAVHISQALAPMAHIAGFDMEIVDPRTAFATAERFPGVVLLAEWPEPVLSKRPLDAYTALAALTHDPKIDDWPLKAALDAGCFYVGALGSRKTHAKRRERLVEAGVSTEAFERIHAPIGLDIGASSPEEIAVAVLAQIISGFRSRGLTVREAAA